MKKVRFFFEQTSIAFDSLKDNKLRTILTMIIIAIGIMALVGIITASDSIKASVNSSFETMGVSTITIYPRTDNSSEIIKGRKRRLTITYEQALAFKNSYEQAHNAKVAVSLYLSSSAKMKYGSIESSPNINLYGTAANGIEILGFKFEKGRDFSAQEQVSGSNVAVIGKDLQNKIFGDIDPIGKTISNGGVSYLIVGTLESKGNTMGQNPDLVMYIPLLSARNRLQYTDTSYDIIVKPSLSASLEEATQSITTVFRIIRMLRPIDKDNFNVESNQSMADNFNTTLNGVSYGIYIFGFVAIFGAAIGLMNMMLVSVTEKTREIGTRKALGASSNAIKQQFLMESILISIMGGLLGIVIGIIIGNVVAIMLGNPFTIPWFWIIAGMTLCFFVGVLSGYLPAVKASKLDPIEALRYE